MADKEKKELANFRNVPYTGPIFWEDLDKDFLIRVLLSWSAAVKDIAWGADGYHGILAKRYGWETAIDISREVAENYCKKYIPVLCDVARVQPKTLWDSLQVVCLSPDGGSQSRKATKELLKERTVRTAQQMVNGNPNHIHAEVDSCPFLDEIYKAVETFGLPPDVTDKMIKDMCEMDLYLGAAYFQAFFPDKKVGSKLPRVPCLKTRGQCGCSMDYWLEEK